MKHVKKLKETFYSIEIDNKYFLSNMNGINKRISLEDYLKLIETN